VLDPLGCQIFSITFWKIWKGRNQLVFNKTHFNSIAIPASRSVKGFMKVREEQCEKSGTSTSGTTKVY
jgi:hypothetical protein